MNTKWRLSTDIQGRTLDTLDEVKALWVYITKPARGMATEFWCDRNGNEVVCSTIALGDK